MKKVKILQRPELPDAHVLSAVEMNKYRLSDGHTVLTPELLAKISADKNGE